MNGFESALIADILAGNSERFAWFVKAYHGAVLAQISSMVRQREDAEELAQDTFVKAFMHLADFNPNCATFSTWLCRIAYNNALSYLRRRRLPMVSMDDEAQLDTITDSEADALLSDDSRLALLDRALDLLPPADYMLINLFYNEARPIAEIAYIMDMQAGTVVTRLSRIRKRLCNTIKQLEHAEH